MARARNAVIIAILCIIGAYSVKKGPRLALMPNTDTFKDAVAGGPSHRRAGPKLTRASGSGDDFRDAVAGHAVGIPNNGHTLDDIAPPPRGGGNGGFGPQANNPGQNFSPPPVLSPSGPPSDAPNGERLR